MSGLAPCLLARDAVATSLCLVDTVCSSLYSTALPSCGLHGEASHLLSSSYSGNPLNQNLRTISNAQALQQARPSVGLNLRELLRFFV